MDALAACYIYIAYFLFYYVFGVQKTTRAAYSNSFCPESRHALYFREISFQFISCCRCKTSQWSTSYCHMVKSSGKWCQTTEFHLNGIINPLNPQTRNRRNCKIERENERIGETRCSPSFIYNVRRTGQWTSLKRRHFQKRHLTLCALPSAPRDMKLLEFWDQIQNNPK